jgi:regulatory protein
VVNNYEKWYSMNSIMHRAMDLLARREHSRFELDRKLRQKGFSQEEIPGTLDSLVKQGLLSDQRFAEEYCRARSKRGFGPRRIEVELQERGVSVEIIEKTLADYDQQRWIELAQSTWSKKFVGKYPRDFKSWAVQRRFLYYRGFTDEQSEWLNYENS